MLGRATLCGNQNSRKMATFMQRFGEVLYGGIRVTHPGHGGEECASYLPWEMKVADTLLVAFLMVPFSLFALKQYSAPCVSRKVEQTVTQKLLAVLLSCVLGIQIGYKICDHSLLYMLNPCHIMTVAEIYLLSTTPNKYSVAVLRLLMHQVYGAAVAMLFPETGPNELFGRLFFYWIQHILIFFVIPPYLIHLWGKESLEPLSNFSWSIFSGIYFGIHQMFILQPLAIMSHVNMNFILCPASVDPFRGPYYRMAAVLHQMLCLLFTGKVYSCLIKAVIPKQKQA